MSDKLTDKIRAAQVIAAEDAIIDSLKDMGFDLDEEEIDSRITFKEKIKEFILPVHIPIENSDETRVEQMVEIHDIMVLFEEAIEKQKLLCALEFINGNDLKRGKNFMTFPEASQMRYRSPMKVRDVILNAPEPTWEPEEND